MTIARFAKKRDANESAIVAALRAAGVAVYPLDRPVDLLCGFSGRWVALEVKRPKGTVGDHQAEFMADCHRRGLPAQIVRTVEDALQAVGAIR